MGVKNEKSHSEVVKEQCVLILKKLLERPYTNEELHEILLENSYKNVEIRTVQLRINQLKKQGIEIEKYSARRGGYIIPEAKKNEYLKQFVEEQDAIYKHVTEEGVDKLLVLLMMQKHNKPLTIKEITEVYFEWDDNEKLNAVDNEQKKNILKSKRVVLKTKCDELCRDRLLYYNVKTKKYEIPKNAPVLLKIDEDTLDNYLYSIKAFGSSYALSEKLKRVEEKLSLYSGENDMSCGKDFIIVGYKTNNNPRVIEKLKLFDQIPYDKYAIRVSIKGKLITVKVGLMVYTVDKDKLYIMGRVKKEKYRIIDVEQIEGKIEVLKDQINDLYETREYIDIYRESFSLSSESVSHVVVEVKDYGNLKRKFQTLCDQRNKMFRGEEHAKITESPKTFDDQKESGEQNTFLYEDNLRGLSDFAKYLRRFGRSVRVIEPEKLRRLMLDDVTRLEEVYRKEGLYE